MPARNATRSVPPTIIANQLKGASVSDSETLEVTGPPPHWWDDQEYRAPLGIRANGHVVATAHRYTQAPKFHIDEGCDGLKRANWDLQTARRFPSVTSLLERAEGRPCRSCALEPFLVRYLRSPQTRASKQRPTIPGGRSVVMFSSQANPLEGNPHNYRYRSATESGAARLRRIAAELGLPTVDTAAGPVTWAKLTAQAASAVATNLRTIVAPAHVGDLDEMLVQTVWSMLVSSPPETGGWGDDVWDLAAAVIS